MTAREIYDLALRSGGGDFQAVTELLERLGEPWCLIGGLAVNVYCEPIYTADADFVVIASQLDLVCAELAGLGFTILSADCQSMRSCRVPASLCSLRPIRAIRISCSALRLPKCSASNAKSPHLPTYSKASSGPLLTLSTAQPNEPRMSWIFCGLRMLTPNICGCCRNRSEPDSD
jgi:hypothetical protein